MTLKASLDAMWHDAHEWHKTGDFLEVSGKNAETLSLSPVNFSCLGLEAGEAYTVIQHKASQLILQGSSSATKMATTLNTVSDDFNTNDKSAAEQFNGLWNWKR